MNNFLQKHIAKIPQAALVSFIGQEIVNALQDNGLVRNQSELADLLLAQNGKEVFKVPGLLKALKYTLEDADLKKLQQGLGPDAILDTSTFRDKLFSKKWGDNTYSNLLLKYFGITDSSFIASYDNEIVSVERVMPRLSSQVKSFEGTPIYTPEMYPLHKYQKKIKDKIVSELLVEGKIFLVHMPTGSGKTKTAAESMVDYWRAKGQQRGFMVWLVHSKELCQQAYDTFKDAWQAKGDCPLNLFRIFENYEPNFDDIDEGVVFAGFQKFYSLIQSASRIPRILKNNTRLIVVDEAHKSIANTYEKAIEYLRGPNTNLMGLTATPGRITELQHNDNLMLALFYNSAPIEVCDDFGGELENPIKYLQDEGYLSRLERETINLELSTEDNSNLFAQSGSDLYSPEFLNRLSFDAIRNRRIVAAIKEKYNEQKVPILVFATNISHALILKAFLGYEGIHSECVFGSTPSQLRAKYLEMFKSDKLPVLLNYEVLTAGFDAPNLKTLLIARPTDSIILYSQMLGRALRGPKMGGGHSVNTVIDVLDNYRSLGTEQGAFNYFSGYFMQ